MNALRGPLGLLLVMLLAIVALLTTLDALTAIETKAAAREREVVSIATQARDLMAIRGLVQEMKKASTPGEPLTPVVERVAGSEGVTVTSTQGVGDVDAGPFREKRVIMRVGGAALGPLKRFLGRLEAAQPGLLVRELTIRHTIGRSDRLDAELVLGQLDPTATAGRPVTDARSAPVSRSTPASSGRITPSDAGGAR